MTVKLYQDKEWLQNKYNIEKNSDPKLAKVCGVYPTTIWKWRKKFNIIARSLGEGQHLATGNHCILSQEAIEWINGELLGDGCLHSYSKWSAQVYYGSKDLEYCEYVRDTLNSFGIKMSGKIYKLHHKSGNCYSYSYISLRYAELLPIRKKWYPNGKKIVPRDIKLTPLTVRQWYIGDGSLSYPRNFVPYIQLCTTGFPILDVEFLKEELIKLGFKATRWKCNNAICISTKSVKDFLNYIGSCPVSCYQYKWNTNRNKGADI